MQGITIQVSEELAKVIDSTADTCHITRSMLLREILIYFFRLIGATTIEPLTVIPGKLAEGALKAQKQKGK